MRDELFSFGDFQLDTHVPVLMMGDRVVALAPKALEVLTALVRNAGQVISKEDLCAAVWPGTAVEEGNLTVHVSHLRKAM